MISEDQMVAHLEAIGLPRVGVDYVRRVRSSPPSRNVGSNGARNTTWRYASQKMGCTIQGESTLERNFLVRCEYAEEVIEFWDQPEPISVTFIGKSGRPQRVGYTADLLVIEPTRVVAYQVKPKSECARLIEQRATRWTLVNGRYIDEPAGASFRALGIDHIVVTEDDISAIAAENYSLLLQAPRRSAASDERKAEEALSILAAEGVLAVGDLLRKLGETDVTTVLNLIDDGRIVALLDEHRLALPDALIGIKREELQDVAESHSELLMHRGRDGVPHTEAPSLEQVKVIAFRRRQLSAGVDRVVSEKTIFRWRRALEEANGDIRALAPKVHLRGNRERRIDPVDLGLMQEAINTRILTPNHGTTTAAYCVYVEAHQRLYERVGAASCLQPKAASLPTFSKEVGRIALAARAGAQGGKRLANTYAAPIDPHVRALNPLRPFERAHIDHYEIDQHVVVLTTGKDKRRTKRPWLTVMIDQATGVVLAIAISFRSPSRRACACVMRDCVRRHGRLPETIVVDNGTEFESVYFEVLLARYGVTKHERPTGDPRFGGQIESTFHTIREELIRSLQGSTSNDERGRNVSVSHRGQAQACWRLHQVYSAYENYFYEHFNLKVRGSNVCTANCHFDELLEAFPFSGMPADFDEAFLVATAVPMDDAFTVTHNRGITHHGRWFFHADLMHVPNGSRVKVLEDPWDDGCVYASVRDRWVPCLAGSARSAPASHEPQMLRSITFLETQAMRAEEALARRVTLEADVTKERKAVEVTSPVPNSQGKPTGARKRLPPAPVDVKPQPYATYQGDFHGHPKHR
jgi:transposase InsO family protein